MGKIKTPSAQAVWFRDESVVIDPRYPSPIRLASIGMATAKTVARAAHARDGGYEDLLRHRPPSWLVDLHSQPASGMFGLMWTQWQLSRDHGDSLVDGHDGVAQAPTLPEAQRPQSPQ